MIFNTQLILNAHIFGSCSRKLHTAAIPLEVGTVTGIGRMNEGPWNYRMAFSTHRNHFDERNLPCVAENDCC
jgi:hypothetical protein